MEIGRFLDVEMSAGANAWRENWVAPKIDTQWCEILWLVKKPRKTHINLKIVGSVHRNTFKKNFDFFLLRGGADVGIMSGCDVAFGCNYFWWSDLKETGKSKEFCFSEDVD